MRPLSFSLRWLGFTMCFGAVLFMASQAISYHYGNLIFASRPDTIESLLDEYSTWARVFSWSGIAAAGLCVAGTIFLFRAVPTGRARTLAATATVFTIFGLALALFEQLGPDLPAPLPGQPVLASLMIRRAMWLLSTASEDAVLPIVLGAALVAVPPLRRLTMPIAIALAILGGAHIGLRAYVTFGPSRSDVLVWFARALRLLCLLLFAGGALLAASRTIRSGESGGTEVPRLGAPLRFVGYALLLRVGVGLIGQTVLVAMTATKDFVSARAMTTLTLVFGLATGLLVAMSLVAYLRLPENYRSARAIGTALAAVAVGALVDAWSGITAVELLELTEKAVNARSMWEVPSLSRLDETMTALRWAGRIAVGLGLVGMIAVLSSFSATAIALVKTELRDRARSTVRLAIVAGIGAIGASFALNEPQAAVFGLLLGAVVLILAVVILTAIVRLCFELGRALDAAAA